MAEMTAEQIAQRIVELNLLDDRQMQSAWGEFGQATAPAGEFLQFLMRREQLTNYQVTRLQNGERAGFFYGPYKVLYLVSAGSFARVYRAVDSRNGRVVAVKVLRKRFSEDLNHCDQFIREGEMGRSLRHPNIVPIHEACSHGKSHFLVMEFVEGNNLREFLKTRKKLAPEEATRILIDIANGLHYAAGRGVCHRDLKLTNVLMSSRGQARLVDFGLAGADERIGDEALESQANPRTIDYAGLERATGVRKDDQRSDVYFMGCIYYHLLTGKSPLQETKDRIQRLSKQRFLDVVPIHQADPELPRVVTLIVNKAMEFDPDKRYQSPGQMLIDLNLAAKRLAEPDAGHDAEPGADGDAPPLGTDAERNRLEAMLIPNAQRKALMFVESNLRMQDIFRDGLKRCGYRVLLTSDPQRALARFEDEDKPADCVVFSTGDLGESALEAFNAFGDGEKTRHVPAVLLLGDTQRAWKKQAKLAKHRVAVSMPLKLRQLRRVLAELVPPLP
ncbi:MAG: protein kinase [Pirellulales bacterium]|nr:protein kinase [Pirellulales bacterium]